MSTHYKKLVLGLSVLLLVSLVLSIWGTSAIAQGKYPNRPVNIIIPFSPGGATDISVRRLQPYLQKALGVSVIAQNKKGAGGRIGATEGFRAKPDGYTLLAHNLPTIILGQLLFNAAYDISKFTQIYGWISESRVVAVHPDSEYKTFEDLLKASRTKELTAGGVGFGVTDHLQGVLLKQIVGLKHRFIPFGSGGKAIQAVLGKHTDFAMPAAVSAQPHFDNGKIRVLAIHSENPVPSYKGVPTFRELGYEGMVLSVDRGLMGPPGMDEEIVKILARAMNKAVNNPKFLETAKKAGEPIKPMSREQWKARIEEVHSKVKDILPLMKADMKKKSK